jgi:hypothetical protein
MYKMDHNLSMLLMEVILFAILASKQVYQAVKKAGVADDNVSLVARAALFGALAYFGGQLI